MHNNREDKHKITDKLGVSLDTNKKNVSDEITLPKICTFLQNYFMNYNFC